MKLEIHSEAMSRFNEVGLSLIQLCKESKYPLPNESQNLHFPSPYVTATIGEDAIDEILPSMKNSSGKKISQYFFQDEKMIGLDGENYTKFIKLCEAIQKSIKPKFTVSISAIEEECFNWIRGYFRDNLTTTLLEFVIPKIEEKISELEIWIPIAQLGVESNIEIGRTEIRPISEQLINSWRDALVSKSPPEDKDENEKYLTGFFDKYFKKTMQGWSASVLQIKAEPIAAKEYALYETERSLSILRLFSEAATNPDVNCYVAIMGQENIESVTTFAFKGGLFSSHDKKTVDDNQRPWHLTDSSVIQMHKMIDVLNKILVNESPTKFQENILDSITLYSMATRAKEYSSKLIYILSALEGIFLKNENESIQQNLGERIAVSIGKDLEERKNIINNIKAIYGLRSAFLHHAHTIDSNKEFGTFMFNAYRAIVTAIRNHDRFPTKEGFASAIDDKKLS